jgi:hypothetical protein
MSATFFQAFVNFFQSLTGIGISLLNSAFVVFQAIVALFQSLFQNSIQLVQAFIKLGLDVFQGVLGFITGESQPPSWASCILILVSLANFLVLAVLGGGYYFYSTRHSGTRWSRRVNLK